jgi:hypothetical protein
MISELRKSINSILFERITSPFYGTLIASWLIWNWKIPYLTVFVSETNISGTKIDFIINNYSNVNQLVIFPLISTFILLTLIPFISNGAYWLQLKFNKWKIDKKNEIEMKQLLTLEQSISIRKEIRVKEKEFEDLLEKKEKTIELLQNEIIELEKSINQDNSKISSNNKLDGNKIDYEDFKKNKEAFSIFNSVVKSIKDSGEFPSNISEELKEYFLVNEIIEEKYISGRDYYNLTEKGKNFYRDSFNENIYNK